MKRSYLFLILLVILSFTTSLAQEMPGIIEKGRYQGAFDVYVGNKFAAENQFKKKKPDLSATPTFENAKQYLPAPEWENHPLAIRSYWRAWKLAFSHLESATTANGYITPYIDPHFNGCIFLWDDCFMTMFGKYGERAFHFQGSLDNFYVKQDPDGYICRQFENKTGGPSFEKNNLASTGPNVFPWAEWEYYLNFKDKQRLSEVFPVLVAYHQWTKLNRSWQDGSYYSCGWGCGMDNQARLEPGYDVWFDHGFMSWIDITLQEILSGKLLQKMADELGRHSEIKDIDEEVNKLTTLVNTKMWDDETAFYYDKQRDQSLTKVLSVSSYWALLAEVVPADKLQRFVAHLMNKNEFDRTTRVPSLAASDPHFDPNGGYWNGSVWASTNYMVLRGLTHCGLDSLAFEIGKSYHNTVTEVFGKTGTFFENYAPDYAKGNDRTDFVGWTGLVPINVMIEYLFGIRADVPHNTLTVDVRLTDKYSLKNYPFGKNGVLDIAVDKRKKGSERPKVSIHSNVDLTVLLKWQNGSETISVKRGK